MSPKVPSQQRKNRKKKSHEELLYKHLHSLFSSLFLFLPLSVKIKGTQPPNLPSKYSMEDYNRSTTYHEPPPMPSACNYDLRCYSASYSQSEMANNNKKTTISGSSSSSKSWSFGDPEFQRKKRVASYKMYMAEGKVKGSFRRSFRWLKVKYTQVVYGWW